MIKSLILIAILSVLIPSVSAAQATMAPIYFFMSPMKVHEIQNTVGKRVLYYVKSTEAFVDDGHILYVSREGMAFSSPVGEYVLGVLSCPQNPFRATFIEHVGVEYPHIQCSERFDDQCKPRKHRLVAIVAKC